MLIKRILFTVFLALGFVAFSSCSDDKDESDTTGPVITLTDPNDGDSFARGEDIHITFDLEDESGLNNYKIDIHWGEGHTHKSAVVAHSEPIKEKAWNYLKVYNDDTEVKGKKKAHVHIHTDEIPEDAKLGEYHFGVFASDLKGNESKKYITMKIVEKVAE